MTSSKAGRALARTLYDLRRPLTWKENLARVRNTALMPLPSGGDDRVDVAQPRHPAELGAGPAGVGNQHRRVVRPARADGVRHLAPGHPLHGVEDLTYAYPAPVPRLKARVASPAAGQSSTRIGVSVRSSNAAPSNTNVNDQRLDHLVDEAEATRLLAIAVERARPPSPPKRRYLRRRSDV